MAKTDTKNRRKRLSIAVTTEPVEEEENPTTGEQSESLSSTEHVALIEEDGKKDVAWKDTPEEDSATGTVLYKVKGSAAPTVTVSGKTNDEGDEEQRTATEEMTADNMMDKDSEMETVTYEVKGSTVTTVSVSWEKKEEGKKDDEEKRTDSNGQMTADDTMDKAGETITTVETVVSVKEAPKKKKNKKKKKQKKDQEMVEPEDKQEVQIDTVEREDIKMEANECETVGSKRAVKRKRKAESTATVTTSPPKKGKLINDGYCLYIGNLNTSTQFEKLKNSLATYFMTHSLLVQDIRLDRSKKHAHVDLASQMDLTKALTLNGKEVLGQPMKIRKAKVKIEEEVKDPLKKKKAKDARCLFVKNVPHTATKQDILKLFPKATAVRFLDGAESPKKGIAFVEFQNKAIAERAQREGQKAKVQGKVLLVSSVGKANKPEMNKANNDTKSNTKAAPPPNKILFVSNVPQHFTEKRLKNVYQTAININIPKSNQKSRGIAFIEFATVEDAEKAMASSQNIKICKRKLRVQFCLRPGPQEPSVVSKTLFVKGLAEKTTAQTLKSAFEGALSAKVIVDKDTGVSKKFGFVNFKTEEVCKSAKDAFEDCQIDGSQVTVAYSQPRPIRGVQEEPKGGKGGKGGQSGAGPTQQTDKEVENIG